MPLAAVDVFMNADFLQYFQEKAVEYTTVDKTYCSAFSKQDPRRDSGVSQVFTLGLHHLQRCYPPRPRLSERYRADNNGGESRLATLLQLQLIRRAEA